MTDYTVSINNNDYTVTTEVQENSVTLSRVGSQGTKGDSVTQAYMDSNGDLHIVIRRANGDLVSDTNVGGSEYIDSLESLYDQFDDRYLGNKTSAPTVDNDGDALLTGALFFNTTTNELGVYNGTSWEYPAEEAATSATNAATSESNAAASEANAASSATNAATSEANAATSESNALASETAAATSETNAATSETNAANSASASSTSATSSASSATAAASSASAAASSETNAATSASNASASAADAATSEQNAATSETNAANSASDALQSETNASNAASNAVVSAGQAAVSEQNASTSQQSAATNATNAANSATSASNSAANAAASLASVETIYDNFDDRFLGTKLSDPTTDNDGNALVVGTFYYNSTNNELKVYSGSGWVAPSTSASNSASAAATSATSAANSASSAATSESNANTYASQALTSATNAATSYTNTEALYDDFEDTFLGTKTTDPSVDNDGNALAVGALYYNSTSSEIKVWNGSSWDAFTTDAETAATNAATSETNAANSATSAATSAANAATSETNASTSETNAATSETNAANSATAAASSASAAATSESNAATSESNASTSETNAATSATNAANSATASAASASAAATSESNAATSESNASTSETNAASSATAAANSATAAATSASNAATSESNAATSESNAATSESNAAGSATAAASSASAASTSETNAAASATAAAASYDSFDDRYLGPKSSDPTVDNDGDALLTGALFFDTTGNVLKVYDGSSWGVASATTEVIQDTVDSLLTEGNGITLTYDDAGNTLTIESEVIEETVTNNTASTITKGTPVYQSGTAGQTIEIAPAAANSSSTMPAIGIVAEDITASGTGKLALIGRLQNVDTSAFSEGDTLYISASGGLTTTAPSGEGNLIQNIGKVTKSNASSGSIMVTGAGRANATPNLNDGNIFIGNSSNQATTAALTVDLLGDVDVTTVAPTNGDSLIWDGTNFVPGASFSQSDFDTAFAAKDTDDLSEGTTNLYYTDNRVQSYLSGGTATSITTTSDINVGTHVDFDIQSAHASYQEGRLWYDNIHKTLNYYSDDQNVIHEIGIEEHQRVYNNSGSTITKGSPLYFSGNYTAGSLDVPTVGLADATDVNAYNAQGLAASDIPNNSYGYCIIAGQLFGLNTSALTAGTNFFVGLSPGAVQNASPTYPNYPMCLGWVVNSHASEGVLLVNQQNHSVNSFRVRTAAHIGTDLIVDGNLTVNGTQTIASSENISVGGAFTYMNAGDTIGEANTTFTGSGLDDAFFTGHYTGTTSTTYYVKIDGTGTPDTFSWSKDNFSTTEATGVSITGSDQLLDNGISINFGTTTGHTTNDVWSGTGAPVNVDSGVFSNRNTGTSGVGYTHMGYFFDVTDEKFHLLDTYDPEPSGTIDLTDASVNYGTLKANFEGNLTGNVTGNITGNASGSASSVDAADNVKSYWGTNNDLEIYANGGYSYIDEVGANNLNIRTNGANIGIYDTANSQYMAKFTTGGDAELYYNGAEKLATTSTGVNITGTLTSDGLTVDGAVVFDSSAASANIVRIDGAVNQNTRLVFRENGTDKWNIGCDASTDVFNIYDSVNSLNRFAVENNGNISFYDTSGNSNFYWDASTMALGIGTGTTTPTNPITIQQTSVHWPYIALTNISGVTKSQFGYQVNDDLLDIVANSGGIKFRTNNTESMRLDSSGNLLIGTTTNFTGTYRLVVQDASSEMLALNSTASSLSQLSFGNTSATLGATKVIANGLDLAFITGSAERMRIDSSGFFLVGKTSGNQTDTVGVELKPQGVIVGTADSSGVGFFNRKTSDGDILVLRKNNTNIGTIGVDDSTVLDIRSTSTNFYIQPNNATTSASNNVWTRANVKPWSDNYYDLGVSSYRWKNLYLSGAVRLNQADFTTVSSSTASTTQTTIATFSTSYEAAKYIITAKSGVNVTISEMLIAHDGTTAVATEYGTVNTGGSALATYDVDINSGNVRLLATAASATSTTYSVVQTLINA